MASSSPSPSSSLNLLLLAFISIFYLSIAIRNPDELDLNIDRPSLPSNGDIHDLFPKYGFPKGLLPGNVKSYTISDDGDFEIHLESACYVQFDLLVYYGKTLKGKMRYGSVSDVSGIQAKKLFVWLAVTGMKVDSNCGMIEFFVGALSEKLPANQFEEIPRCKNKAWRALKKPQQPQFD